MADLRPQHDEEVVAANHPTKADVTNRAWNVEHAEDGMHKSIFGLKIKVIEIGNWDMDAVAGVDIAHGLTLGNIRSVQVLIRNDTDDGYFPLDFTNNYTEVDGRWQLNATDVNLDRRTGSLFDTNVFDTMGDDGNRGWITIWYVA